MVLLPESENDIVKIVKICMSIILLLLQEGPDRSIWWSCANRRVNSVVNI